MQVNYGIMAVAVVGLMVAAGAAMAGEMPAMVKAGDSSLGPVLTDTKGMTLYYFDKDAAGKSNCNGKCAEAWPPLMAGDGAKSLDDFTIVVRDDGGKQWAHRGLPLYRWVKDEKPGDTTGHRFKNVWTVAQP
jgi:predicted lipoprotein with Yx(FWY)xxD motif